MPLLNLEAMSIQMMLRGSKVESLIIFLNSVQSHSYFAAELTRSAVSKRPLCQLINLMN